MRCGRRSCGGSSSGDCQMPTSAGHQPSYAAVRRPEPGTATSPGSPPPPLVQPEACGAAAGRPGSSRWLPESTGLGRAGRKKRPCIRAPSSAKLEEATSFMCGSPTCQKVEHSYKKCGSEAAAQAGAEANQRRQGHQAKGHQRQHKLTSPQVWDNRETITLD